MSSFIFWVMKPIGEFIGAIILFLIVFLVIMVVLYGAEYTKLLFRTIFKGGKK